MERPKKSVLRAYMWLILLGVVGAHRFYLKRSSTGLLYAMLSGIAVACFLVGTFGDQADILYASYFVGAFVIAGLLVDFVSIPGMIEDLNNPGEDRRLAVISGNLDPSFQATARSVGRDDPDKPKKSALPDDYERPWQKKQTKSDVYRPGDE